MALRETLGRDASVVLYEIVRWLFKLFNRLRLHEIREYA